MHTGNSSESLVHDCMVHTSFDSHHWSCLRKQSVKGRTACAFVRYCWIGFNSIHCIWFFFFPSMGFGELKMSWIKGWSLLSFWNKEVLFYKTIWRIRIYLWCSIKLKTLVYSGRLSAKRSGFPLIRRWKKNVSLLSVCPPLVLSFIPFATSLLPAAPPSDLSSTPSPHVPVLASYVEVIYLWHSQSPIAVAKTFKHTHTHTHTQHQHLYIDIWGVNTHTHIHTHTHR